MVGPSPSDGMKFPAMLSGGMTKHHTVPRKLRQISLPLFDWADQRIAVLTAGGAFLRRRKFVSPVLANLVAELAGIGPGLSL